MKIAYIIEICEPEELRYSTAGDYFSDENGVIHIQVCKQLSEEKNFLIIVHEMVEEMITRKNGIEENTILQFDIKVDKEGYEGEPGDHKDSPYRRAHRFSENIERQIAHELNVDWKEYDDNIVVSK